MLSLTLIVTCLYVILLGLYLFGAFKLPEFNSPKKAKLIGFSVIVPFRNEAEYLNEFLSSFECLNYPHSNFEIILVNDSSEDASVSIVEEFIAKTELDIKLFHSSGISKSPKKEALLKGIQNSKNNWVVTTDADCKVPKTWLTTLSAFISSREPNMVVMPVFLENYYKKPFECIETLCLQVVTMGSFGIGKPIMNNGANLAYQKVDFFEVEGFQGNDEIASGDDLFLMEKFEKSKKSVEYLKSNRAIVLTKPQATYSQYISQRVRWASKTSASKNILLKLSGLVISCMNLLIVILFFQNLILFNLSYSFLFAVILKLSIDLLIVVFGANYFNYKLNYFNFLKQSVTYPFVNIFVAFHSLFGSFSWKNRVYQK